MTPLENQIKTVADLHGVELTADALQRVKERTQELAHQSSEATGEFKGFTTAQKEQAQALADSLPPLKDTTTQAEKLGRTFVGVKGAVTGLGGVMGGLANGDVVQLGKGLLDLNRVAANATGAMKAFLGSVASGAAIGAAFAAPLILAIFKWTKAAEQADKEIQEIWAGQGKSTKALADEQERQTQRMIKNNDALQASYRNVTSEINDAASAAAGLAAEKTKQAILLASTPEEKQQIQQDAEIEQAQRNLETADQEHRAAVALSGDEGAIRRSNNALTIARERLKTANLSKSVGQQSSAKAAGNRGSPAPPGEPGFDAPGARRQLASADRGLNDLRAAASGGDAAIIAKLRDAEASRDALANAIANSAERDKARNAKLARQLKLAAQAGPGGGG